MGSSFLRRLDAGLAQGETAIAGSIFVAMVLLAATQVLLYNLSTHLDAPWAHAALSQLVWVDPFLQRGTLCLAFLGASLATHHKQHIAIDALTRTLPRKVRQFLRIVVSAVVGVTCFQLARSFYTAALRAQERPSHLEIWSEAGSLHVCDAAPAQLPSDSSRPEFFCALRDLFDRVGVGLSQADGTRMEVESPLGAVLLIVPISLFIMALRFVAQAVGPGAGNDVAETVPQGTK